MAWCMNDHVTLSDANVLFREMLRVVIVCRLTCTTTTLLLCRVVVRVHQRVLKSSVASPHSLTLVMGMYKH